ncbi:MAG: lactonase family protein, partial [Caldilineaceae bacterium]|nr:lactonase family protein [Caldilineaceae bacterium]
ALVRIGVIPVMALAPHRPVLYAVQEVGVNAAPLVDAFAVDPATGRLTHLNSQPAHGGFPCHLSVHPAGRHVAVAHYETGSVSIYPVLADGRLGEATDIVHHEGHGHRPDRQEGPHAHSAVFDPEGRFLLVADLGLDQIMIYRLELDQGQLAPHELPHVSVHTGAGPRHVAFHPHGHHLFVINELDATVSSFAFADGMVTARQTLAALPEDFTGTPSGSAIRVAPSGRFVYTANREHDSIAIFAFDEQEGVLSLVGHEPTRGRTPRDFAIDPAGAYLLVANQDSDSVEVFHIEAQNGRLSHTGERAVVPNPVSLVML